MATVRADVERVKVSDANHPAGVNAKALSTYMGHANISVTLDLYGHLMPGNEEETAGLLDSYLERANTAARLAQMSA